MAGIGYDGNAYPQIYGHLSLKFMRPCVIIFASDDVNRQSGCPNFFDD